MLRRIWDPEDDAWAELAPAIAKRRAFERNPMAKKVLDHPELVGAEDTLVSLANGLSSAEAEIQANLDKSIFHLASVPITYQI